MYPVKFTPKYLTEVESQLNLYLFLRSANGVKLNTKASGLSTLTVQIP